jgi:hypothetical protein
MSVTGSEVMHKQSGRKHKSMRPLAAREVDAICRRLVPIGESVFNYIEGLQAAGFCAFVPIMRFEKGFCQSEEERTIYRRCSIERAKQRLGRPSSFPASAQEHSLFYSSSYLQELIAKRDQANGVPEEQLADRYPREIWRREVEACGRRRVMASIIDRTAFEAQGRAMENELREIIAREVALHAQVNESGNLEELEHDSLASRISRLTQFGHQNPKTSQEFDRFWFFRSIMDREATALGFEYDRRKSRVNYPVFSKAVGGVWDLCWAIENRTGFMVPHRGLLHLTLQLRQRRLSGPIGAKSAGLVLRRMALR